jgi:hypothetical protein
VVLARGVPGTVQIAQLPGDQVTVLKRTGSGFIAAGVHMPGGGRSAPVIFLSANGTGWARSGPSLAAGNGRALDIRLAAAAGRQILIAGDVATGSGRTATVRTGGAWLSDDGGRSWTAVTVPTGHGAQDQFSDAATTADGFLLVDQRPGRIRPRTDRSRLHRDPRGRAAHLMAAPHPVTLR